MAEYFAAKDIDYELLSAWGGNFMCYLSNETDPANPAQYANVIKSLGVDHKFLQNFRGTPKSRFLAWLIRKLYKWGMKHPAIEFFAFVDAGSLLVYAVGKQKMYVRMILAIWQFHMNLAICIEIFFKKSFASTFCI